MSVSPLAQSSITDRASVEFSKRGSALSKEAQEEKVARRFWVTGIVSLLSIQVLIGGASIYLANSDSTVAVIPNYYDSAVNWDATRRARQRMADLRWKTQASVGPVLDGKRVIRLDLESAVQEPITGLNIAGKSYHHARGSEIHSLAFEEVTPGRYEAATSLTQAGQWELSLRIEGDHGIAELVQGLWVD